MTKYRLSMTISFVILALFSWMMWDSLSYSRLAQYFPLFLSAFGVICILIEIAQQYRESKRQAPTEIKDNDAEEEMEWDIAITHDFRTAAKNFLWVVFYFVLILALGFIAATVVFLVVFLKVRTNYNWFKVVLATATTIGLLLLLENIMHLKWPVGLLPFAGTLLQF